jgi:hypothetical protein
MGYADLVGKKKIQGVLKTLHGYEPVVQALSTPIGEELLREVSIEWKRLLAKIVRDESTPEDRIRFRIMDEILQSWGSKISAFFDLSDKFDSISKKGEL